MKNYRVKIYFHSGQSELFGYSGDSVDCIVPENIKDGLVGALEHDKISNGILSVDMQDGGTRYINMKTVLYVDVKETKDE